MKPVLKILLCTYLLLSTTLQSQNSEETEGQRVYRNGAFIEAGGTFTSFIWVNHKYVWLDFSLNYERFFFKKKNASLRLGMNLPIGRFEVNPPAHVFGALWNGIWGRRSFQFETGAGMVFYFADRDYSQLRSYFNALIGVRYSPAASPFYWRLVCSGLYYEDKEFAVFPKCGLSFGYLFGRQ